MSAKAVGELLIRCCFLLENDHECIQHVRSGARPATQGDKRVPSLVATVACLRARLFPITCLENGFVDNVARIHGCSVSDERFPLWPCSLLLHRTVFHPWRYCLARVWGGISAVRTIGMEMDRHRNNYWRDCALLHSRIYFWPLSAQRIRLGLTNR